LRIWDVYPGSEFFPSWIHIKELKNYNPENRFQALENMMLVVHPESEFLPIPDSEVKKAPDPGSATLTETFFFTSFPGG
jgi:hypothetical protein